MDSEGLAFKFLSERVYLFMLLLCMLCWKHYLVQKNGKVEERLFAIKILFRGKSKVQPVIFILQRKINFPQLFLHEEMFLYFCGKFANKSSLIFLMKKLPGETLCKLLQIFPPKVLVYVRVDFSRHLLN